MWVCFTLIQYRFPKYRQQLLAPLDSTPGPGDLKGIARCDGYHGISWILCGFPYMKEPKNGWFMIGKKQLIWMIQGSPYLWKHSYIYLHTTGMYHQNILPVHES